MFDIGWSELLVIGVVALIAIGPKELPGVLRMVGQWMGKVRRMASEFQSQFNEAMREAEVADLKKQVDDLADTASSYTNYDPLGDVSKQFQDAVEGKPQDTTQAPAVATAPPAPETTAPEAASPAESAKPLAQDNATQQSASAEPASDAQPSAQPKVGSGA